MIIPFNQLEPFSKVIANVTTCALVVCVPAYCLHLLARKRG